MYFLSRENGNFYEFSTDLLFAYKCTLHYRYLQRNLSWKFFIQIQKFKLLNTYVDFWIFEFCNMATTLKWFLSLRIIQPVFSHEGSCSHSAESERARTWLRITTEVLPDKEEKDERELNVGLRTGDCLRKTSGDQTLWERWTKAASSTSVTFGQRSCRNG